MTMLHSPSTGGFYLKGDRNVPADAVPIKPHRHNQLMQAQSKGARIVGNPGGTGPVAVLPTADRTVIKAAVKREAARRIEAISPLWRQLNDQREPTEAGVARFAAIDVVRAASAAIEDMVDQAKASELATFPVTDNPLWPELNGCAA